MRKKTGIIIGIVALAVVIALMLTAFLVLMPKGTQEQKSFTVTVTHGDGSEKVFAYTSEAEYLGTVLLEEGLAEGSMDQYGLYIKSVDGEQAIYEVDGAYWSLTINGEYATTGADMTPIQDGAAYGLVYTRG